MSYTSSDIQHIVDGQRTFFRTGTTLDVKWRLRQLRRLRDAVIAHEKEFEDAPRLAPLGTPGEALQRVDVLPEPHYQGI